MLTRSFDGERSLLDEPEPSSGKTLAGMTGPEQQRCKAKNKNGQPCRGRARESGYCVGHDPSLDEQRCTGRVKGGENSSRVARLEKLMPRRLCPVFELLEKAIEDVYEGRLDPRQATAMAALAGAMVKVLQAGELEEMVRKVQESDGR